MYTITKQFTFSASHQLEGLPDDHPCSRLHGHNYIVEVELQAPALDSVGFVQDYRDLDFVKEMIDRELDHRHLNGVIGINPTAENLAGWVFVRCFERFNKLAAVRVSETPKTWAEYRHKRAQSVVLPRPLQATQISELANQVAELIKQLGEQGGLR